ncbi:MULTISPECIES: hypothetical protein [Arthrobacter]|uniref:Uncharacterized protein n=1 Tax=Arthrobacter terricola TaxID=2547396 RepID=A0A4R5KC35_9MICC|nr:MULTISPECIES: hypothetical protein [Arthrobacter]MBT8162770.1 hypothetical protein [Arthrobacter sp. GN70]TDF92068.1 hypothetical protein E1809_18990 [Arthrobacter terricola]
MAGVSWRDSVPEESANDLETLLGSGIGTAREHLEQHGGFLPFALTVLNDGEVRLLMVAPDTSDAVDSTTPTAETASEAEFDADAMLNDLTELLRQNREECRAAALVCDITLPEEGSDAIHVAAEHKDGSVFAALLPYRPRPGSQWEFGDLTADTNKAVVWVG